MLKVLLVDDEISIVEGLIKTVDWNGHGFMIAGVASDGEEALERAKKLKPDLIITDITMPVMDGIEFITHVREDLRDVITVFLTCHEDFNYARHAVRLDVMEYLIKETMTREELYMVLDKARAIIKATNLQREKESAMSLEINKSKYIIEESIFRSIFSRHSNEKGELEKRLKTCGYSFTCRKFVFSLLQIDRYLELMDEDAFKTADSIKSTVIEIVEAILEEYRFGKIFSMAENEFIIIYNFNHNLKTSTPDQILSISRQLQEGIGIAINRTCTMHVGDTYDSLDSFVEAYRKLRQMDLQRFYSEDGVLISSIDECNYIDDDMRYLLDLANIFENCCNELDLTEMGNTIGALADSACTHRTDVSEIRHAAEKMLRSIIINMEKYGCKYDDISSRYYNDYIKYAHNIFYLRDFLLSFSARAVELISKNVAMAPGREFNKVILYIDKYMHEEITLVSTANHANMNSSYFSRYFKSKTGENFIDYLSRKRIDRAKMLLMGTDLTIDEISERVGHVNKTYFSKVFKKITDLTPGEFKKRYKK